MKSYDQRSLKVKYNPDLRLSNGIIKNGHWCNSLAARGRQNQALCSF